MALAEVLGDRWIGGYRVGMLHNRPSHEVRLRINELYTEAGRDDLLLLYVSGHGVKDESGRLHLVTTDTRRTLLAATAVSAQFIRELIDHSPARKIVVWLDCCFGGAFPAGMVAKAEGTVDVLDQLTHSGRGCVVMTASTHIQYAYERGAATVPSGQGGPSVFTSVIAHGLRTGEADLNGDGLIDTLELYDYVYDRVRDAHPDQTPTCNHQVIGKLYLARRPPQRVVAAPEPTVQRHTTPDFASWRRPATLLYGLLAAGLIALVTTVALLVDGPTNRPGPGASSSTTTAGVAVSQDASSPSSRRSDSPASPARLVDVVPERYLNLPVSVVVDELNQLGIDNIQVRTARGEPPKDPGTCAVIDVRPTGSMPIGSHVIIRCSPAAPG